MSLRSFKILPKCANMATSDTPPLSPEQLKFYEDNGYLVVKKLIGIPALNNYRQRFKDIFNGRLDSHLFSVVKDKTLYESGKNAEQYINKIQDILYDDVFSTYSENPRLLDIVVQLIGEDLTAINLMLINKPPGTAEHAPHQDLLYVPVRPAYKLIGTWTAIDPVNKDNGCLFMVPGSHKSGELYEHVAPKEQIFSYYVADWKNIAPEDKRVELEMDPGDTVFFSSVLVHGSRPNTTKTYRKCMTCHYANSNCHFINVVGTRQEQFAKSAVNEIKRRGGDLSFIDIWRVKMKKVRGVRSNL